MKRTLPPCLFEVPESRDDGIDTRDIHHLARSGRQALLASRGHRTHVLLAADTKAKSSVLRLLPRITTACLLVHPQLLLSKIRVSRAGLTERNLQKLFGLLQPRARYEMVELTPNHRLLNAPHLLTGIAQVAHKPRSHCNKGADANLLSLL